MTQEFTTLELAKIYQRQGYYQDAFEIYSILDAQESTAETREGLRQLESKLESEEKNMAEEEPQSEKKIYRLVEKWLRMMVLKKRLGDVKKMKARLP